jgi:hypothetical protein
MDQSGHGKEVIDQGALNPKEQRGWTSQDMERKGAEGTHSLESAEVWCKWDPDSGPPVMSEFGVEGQGKVNRRAQMDANALRVRTSAHEQRGGNVGF